MAAAESTHKVGVMANESKYNLHNPVEIVMHVENYKQFQLKGGVLHGI
jgi:hypothetical protein